jgi:hypothetical protein
VPPGGDRVDEEKLDLDEMLDLDGAAYSSDETDDDVSTTSLFSFAFFVFFCSFYESPNPVPCSTTLD